MLGLGTTGQIGAILQNAQELWEENGRAYLRPTPSFRMSAERKIGEIRDLVREVAGRAVEVELVEPKEEKEGEANLASVGNNEPAPALDVANDPLVAEAARVFDATIVNVQRKGNRNA